MKNLVIIPARMGSSRFPGKPLEKILGVPMIEHCYKRASLCEMVDDVFIATCDRDIKEYVESFGGKVVMTSRSHNRASTRTEEAVRTIKIDYKISCKMVVMLQGDEPLIRPESISSLIKSFSSQKVDILNLISPIKNEKLFLDKNNVKVVFDKNKRALYFSREPIPSPWIKNEEYRFMQVGVMAFSESSLKFFNDLEESSLEIYESVDMNRVLENGGKIEISKLNYETIGVDCKSDLEKAEELMKLDPVFDKDYSIN